MNISLDKQLSQSTYLYLSENHSLFGNTRSSHSETLGLKFIFRNSANHSNMSSGEEEATLSLPSIAIVAVLGYIIYKYFIAKSNDQSNSSTNGLRFTAAQVEQVAQMFPQLDRRDIMWDLHRNRGSVQATTERALQRGRLDPVSLCLHEPEVMKY